MKCSKCDFKAPGTTAPKYPMVLLCPVCFAAMITDHEEKIMETKSIDETLKERGERYGKFYDHAYISQKLKAVMQEVPKWHKLYPDQKEALEMLAHKVARILNGDPNYVDSWHDCIGYLKLVEDRLNGEKK